MNYRLLALDLDGTVVGADLVIPPAVIRAVAAAQARGITVTLATGRSFAATLPFATQLGIGGPVICYQGGLTREVSSGTIVSAITLPGDLAAEAVEMLLAANRCVIAYINEQLYVAERRPELELYLSYHPEEAEVVIVPELAAVVAEHSPAKLLFIATAEVVDQQLPVLASHFAGRLTTLRSHAIFGELAPLGVSKGVALERLATMLGIAREQVVAIGDQHNDLDMVSWAGLGLAIGNAVPALKAVAAAVLPSVEQAGVAAAIETYLLA